MPTNRNINTQTHVCEPTRAHTQKHTQRNTDMQTHIGTQTHGLTQTHICKHNKHMNTHTDVHTETHTWPSVCFLWRNVYLGLLSFFWLGCLCFFDSKLNEPQNSLFSNFDDTHISGITQRVCFSHCSSVSKWYQKKFEVLVTEEMAALIVGKSQETGTNCSCSASFTGNRRNQWW